MKARAIRSMLVVLAAAESTTEDRFQRRRPTRLTVSCTLSARSSRRSKAMELSCQDNKLAGRQTRRVDVLYQNLPHVDRRPTSASPKLEVCATRLQTKYTSMNSQSGSQKSEV